MSQNADYECSYCGEHLTETDVFDYGGGELAHLVLPKSPYYSAPGQPLPCGQVYPRPNGSDEA